MGIDSPPQGSLFIARFDLESRIRRNHPLRDLDRVLDLGWVYGEVAPFYGRNGNVSVAPTILVKLMLLLMFYNVRSERELMATLPERLDWLWFLGFDLDSEIPNHSVLSKARRRWGAEVFCKLFERVVVQCVEAGLVDGEKLFCDSSLIDANASCNSVVRRSVKPEHLKVAVNELELRLRGDSTGNDDPERQVREGKPANEEERTEQSKPERNNEVNRKFVSTTDPEASVVRKGVGKSRPRYQTHRAIDGAHGVITATVVGPGDENEAHRLGELIDQSHDNTGTSCSVVVADSKYGTTANYLDCCDRGIEVHIPVLKDRQTGRREGIFPEEAFVYRAEQDTYLCPAGQTLRRRNHSKKRGASEYVAPKRVCADCPLREQCTRSTGARSIKRHDRQDDLDRMRQKAGSSTAQRNIRIRQFFMEGSFADAVRFGLKRARWRGLEQVQIQDHLIAVVQNLRLLIWHGKPKPRAAGIAGKAAEAINTALLAVCTPLNAWMCALSAIAVQRGGAQPMPPTMEGLEHAPA